MDDFWLESEPEDFAEGLASMGLESKVDRLADLETFAGFFNCIDVSCEGWEGGGVWEEVCEVRGTLWPTVGCAVIK